MNFFIISGPELLLLSLRLLHRLITRVNEQDKEERLENHDISKRDK